MNSFQHAPRGEPPAGIGPGGSAFDKSALLDIYARRWHCRSLVETGLYEGHGSGMALFEGGTVEQYIAIDYQQSNIDAARERCPGGRYFAGDSAAILAELLGGIYRPYAPAPPVLFWLDAHAISELEPAPQICPVLGELDAIVAWPGSLGSVVLVDDVYGFGSIVGWPPLGELLEACERGGWNVHHDGNVVYCEPIL